MMLEMFRDNVLVPLFDGAPVEHINKLIDVADDRCCSRFCSLAHPNGRRQCNSCPLLWLRVLPHDASAEQ